MPHSLADLLIHVIFSTKDRRPNLDEDLRSRLFPYMAGIVRERGGKTHFINGTTDHVHMLVSVPTPLSAAELMRHVKGSSSRWVHQQFPGRHEFGWQRGFAARVQCEPFEIPAGLRIHRWPRGTPPKSLVQGRIDSLLGEAPN